MGRIEKQPGKETMRLHSEKQACPRRGNPTAVKAVLNCRQTERGGKAFWDAEQSDRHLARCWDARVASEPLCPREARVGTLRAGKDHFRAAKRSCGGRRQAHLDALVSHEPHTGAPMLSPAPIPPEQRRGTNPERMEQYTDPTRLRGCFPVPLTLRTLWAAATIAYPGAVEHAQTAIGFAALLGWAQRLASRTVQHPVGLEGEVLPGETPHFPGQGDRRLAVALHRRLLRCGLFDGGSKLGRAHRSRLKHMTQFQAQVPDPLRDNLPGFLSSGRMRTPPVGVLLLVFIGKHRLKGATMQVECHHIGGGERVLREMGEKEFIDNALAGVTDAALFLGSRVGGHHDAAAHALRPHRDIGAVVELSHQATFRAAELLVGRQVQTALHLWPIQHGVIFAAHHEREACQIGDDGPCPILPIQPQQGARRRKMVCLQIAPDGDQPPAQFLPVASIASVAEIAEPVVTMGLRDDGARTDDLPARAPRVARRTDLVQATLWCRQLLCLWQGTLPGGFPRPIDVKDHAFVACSIYKRACVSLVVQRAREQIGEKEGAQGFCGLPGQARKKARERRSGGQSLAVEQGHEGVRKRQEPLIEPLQRAFAADGVAEEHGKKSDDLVVPETAAGQAHLRADGSKDALLAKIGDDQRDLPEPGRRRGDRLRRGLDTHRDIGDTSHIYLLVGNSFVLPHQGGIFLSWFATGYISLRNSWALKGTFLLLIAALIWSLLPGTWDASGEKSCAREPPSSKRIPISGWPVSAMQAMAITGENCCGHER